MTAVSHFQRFSQRENHATNNTLLVLRHLYQVSPAKLQAVLNTLLEDTQIAIGVQFDQQVRGSQSVPDAHIYQTPWRIYVETKLGAALDADQIERHINSISASQDGVTVLLGLTSGSVEPIQAERLAATAREKNVKFKWITFVDLADALQSQCAEYETALTAIITDYVDYLRGEGLLESRDDWLLVVPCGDSYEENKRFGLYYDAVNRPSRGGCRYLGIYKNRTVSLIGDIVAVIVCSYQDGKAVPQGPAEFGEITEERLSRITAVIEATSYYDLKGTTQRYFVTDGLHETEIRKSTKGGIQGPMYLKIDKLLGARRPRDWPLDRLAQELAGTSFPTSTD